MNFDAEHAIHFIDSSFAATFGLEILMDLSGQGLRYFYPGAVDVGGRDGINVRVSPAHGENWTATFAFGRFGPKSVTGLFTTPNPSMFCVISEGQAYLVSSTDPSVYECLSLVPVLEVRSSVKHQLLIFANHTELVAVGANGIAWRTARLSWDNLKLTTMSDDTIEGAFWDIQTESERTFRVSLSDGSHTGGAFVPI